MGQPPRSRARTFENTHEGQHPERVDQICQGGSPFRDGGLHLRSQLPYMTSNEKYAVLISILAGKHGKDPREVRPVNSS